MREIAPNVVHFVWFSPDGRRTEMHLTQYVCVASALRWIRPERALFWTDLPPAGKYWSLLEDRLEIRPVETDVTSWGPKPIFLPVHKSDKARLDILHRYGGIYLDLDALVLRPFDDLLSDVLVMGRDGPGGLGNGVMIAPKGSPFIRTWMRECPARFNPSGWAEASTCLAFELAHRHPEDIRVLPESAFYYPPSSQWQLLFREPDVVLPESYACHLWSSLCGHVLRWFDESTVLAGWSQFDRIAQEYL